MSDHERGAYTPPTHDAPLSFDARQPVRGSRPLPFTLIISILVLIGLGVAIFVFYNQGVRQAGQPPQAVGQPVGPMTSAPPADAQPQDPAAGLQIYRSESGQPQQAAPAQPQFTAPPEQPQARPTAPPPPPVAAPTTTVAPPAALRPALPATTSAPAPAPAPAAPAPKSAPTPVAAAPAPKPKPAPTPAATPAPAKAVGGAAGVQIGAFSSQALADKGWGDAVAVAPGAAAGKGKAVERVAKDGKTFFRTTVTGFASKADAAAFCGKLKAAGKACFVK
jgi:outer membrane biosynthesis protein TonB